MQRTTMLVRAVMHSVALDLRNAHDRDIEPLDAVAAALENVDWDHFDQLDVAGLCDHVGHQHNGWENLAPCDICGELK